MQLIGRVVTVVLVACAATTVPAAAFAQGCAMCATYLSNGQDPKTDAFKTSILFLMAMPFTIVASTGGWILWMHRRPRDGAIAEMVEGEEAS
jgi:hypothetical protein